MEFQGHTSVYLEFLSKHILCLFFLFVFRALLEKELESVGIRLNRTKPNIYFKVQCVYLSFFCLTVGISEIRRL